MANKGKIVLSGHTTLLMPLLQQAKFQQEISAEIRAESRAAREKHQSFVSSVKDRPRVVLYFYRYDPSKNRTYTAELSYRLVNETIEGMTFDKMKVIAQKIKTKFENFEFTKGKKKLQYSDWPNGYCNSSVLCETVEEGTRVFEQFLDLQGMSIDETKLSEIKDSNPTGKYPENPSNITVAGKTEEGKELRPITKVKYVHSQIFLGNLARYTLDDAKAKLPPAPFDLD
ncbi:MAG: hypothetical protein F6K41_05250 [Symploca sp. SIO3E6]|nr:hypothetical protein [Caldora sp. SIO3E6]